MSEPALKLRTYQLPVFLYDGKLLIAEFARQDGKSFTCLLYTSPSPRDV